MVQLADFMAPRVKQCLSPKFTGALNKSWLNSQSNNSWRVSRKKNALPMLLSHHDAVDLYDESGGFHFVVNSHQSVLGFCANLSLNHGVTITVLPMLLDLQKILKRFRAFFSSLH